MSWLGNSTWAVKWTCSAEHSSQSPPEAALMQSDQKRHISSHCLQPCYWNKSHTWTQGREQSYLFFALMSLPLLAGPEDNYRSCLTFSHPPLCTALQLSAPSQLLAAQPGCLQLSFIVVDVLELISCLFKKWMQMLPSLTTQYDSNRKEISKLCWDLANTVAPYMSVVQNIEVFPGYHTVTTVTTNANPNASFDLNECFK